MTIDSKVALAARAGRRSGVLRWRVEPFHLVLMVVIAVGVAFVTYAKLTYG